MTKKNQPLQTGLSRHHYHHLLLVGGSSSETVSLREQVCVWGMRRRSFGVCVLAPAVFSFLRRFVIFAVVV